MQVASQPTSPEPFSYVVDEDVEPIVDALPALDGNTVRTLTAVQDPHGNVASFVVDELVVQTNDAAVLNNILARYNAETTQDIGVPNLVFNLEHFF